MPPLSDRQHDAFDNPAKMACREGNLRVLREAAYLLWENGDRTRLRCDWCELMGETGLRTLELLEREGVLAPGGFVGVDLDRERIEEFRTRRPDLKWVAANLYERLDAPELATVGVLNLDAYGEIGDPDSMGDFRLIRGLAARGLERFGEFALFWNQDLDSVVRRRGDRGQALRRHAEMVCRALAGLSAAPRTGPRDAPAAARRGTDRVGVRRRAGRVRDLPRKGQGTPNGQPATHPALDEKCEMRKCGRNRCL